MTRDTAAALITAAVAGGTRSVWKGLLVGVVAAVALKKLGVPDEIPSSLETGLNSALNSFGSQKGEEKS